MNLPLKVIIESVLIGVISTLFVLLIAMIPILNVLVLLFPVPLIVVGVRRGVAAGLASLLIAGLLMSLVVHSLLGLLFIMIHLFLVAGLPFSFQKGLDFYENILISSFGSLVSILITLQAYGWIAGRTFFNMLWQGLRDFFMEGVLDFEQMLALYHQMGLLREFENARQVTEVFISQMQLMVPSALLIFSIVFGVLNFLVARLVLRKLRHEVPFVPEFSGWALPRGMGFGFLLLLLFSYIGSTIGIDNFHGVFLTVYSLVSFIFMVQGLAVLWYFLRAGKVPVPLRWVLMVLIYVILHMILTLNMGLTVLGIADQVFRLRKAHQSKFLKVK